MALPEPMTINLTNPSSHEENRKHESTDQQLNLTSYLHCRHFFLCWRNGLDVVIKNLLLQQIKYKLQLVDGEVKKSKVRAIMKLCVRHISAAINRSASRNIFLKATKMVNLARHTQQNFSSSSSCDLTSSSSSSSPEDLIQQFELQIMNQNVIQIQI